MSTDLLEDYLTVTSPKSNGVAVLLLRCMLRQATSSQSEAAGAQRTLTVCPANAKMLKQIRTFSCVKAFPKLACSLNHLN